MSANNARLIEKDILAAIPATAAGDSEIIDLFGISGGASKFSCHAVYDVQSPTAKTFDSGGAEVDTGTFQAKASTNAGDYIVINDTAGLSWAVYADVTGSDQPPSGAIWSAIPVPRKGRADLGAASTAANVATAFAAAFEALVAVPFASVAGGADVVFTQDLYGAVTAPSVHNTGDTGPGTITVVVTDAGVNSEVNVDANTVTVPVHGYTTGFKVQLTTTGTLPGGLATATDYFLIVVDANTLKFATSLANALAGTAINITNQGSDEAVNTITGVAIAGASVTFRKSNDGVDWIDVQTATSITVDGSVMTEQPNVSYRYFKAVKALTSGQVDLKALICVLGDAT